MTQTEDKAKMIICAEANSEYPEETMYKVTCVSNKGTEKDFELEAVQLAEFVATKVAHAIEHNLLLGYTKHELTLERMDTD